jgi:hypothetical protein
MQVAWGYARSCRSRGYRGRLGRWTSLDLVSKRGHLNGVRLTKLSGDREGGGCPIALPTRFAFCRHEVEADQQVPADDCEESGVQCLTHGADLEHNVLRLTKAWDRRAKAVKTTKGKWNRRLPIDLEIAPLLAMLKEERSDTGRLSKATAGEYAEAMRAGAVFPPVVVFVDPKGAHWLADGFHRCAGAELAGLAEVAADVRQGSRKDALLYAASANASHGLRRTNADKRRAVLLVLGNFPKWSDRKVGEACGVDHKTVSAARASLAPEPDGGEIPQSADASELQASNVLVSRLGKVLDRVIQEWPAERRAELLARVEAGTRTDA